jgi:negative regulator of flagellin synthesis FlgM
MVIDTNNISSSGGANRSRSTVAVVAPSAKALSAPANAVEQGAKDKVVLSSEAQNLVRLQSSISNLPDVNMDRVMAIKQAIAEGRFEINPERIAENMLKQDELLG